MTTLTEASKITIYTPNLLNLKKTGVAQVANGDIKQELLLCLKHVLSESPEFKDGSGAVQIFPPKHFEDLELATEDLEITVKLFFLDPSSPPDCSDVHDALDSTLNWLNIKKVDLLVMALYGLLLHDDSEEFQHKLEPTQINSLWGAMEEQYINGKAIELGVCEFSKSMLVNLISKARIKPSVNQVNLSDCCVIPKSLREYAKAENVKLFTHNDPNDLMSFNDFNALLAEHASAQFQPKWASRYSISYKLRGIVASQGYIVHARMT